MPDHCNSQTLRWSASSLAKNELYWHCLGQSSTSSTAPMCHCLPIITSHHHAHDKISQAFCLHFAYWKQLKTGAREDLGMRSRANEQSHGLRMRIDWWVERVRKRFVYQLHPSADLQLYFCRLKLSNIDFKIWEWYWYYKTSSLGYTLHYELVCPYHL